MTWFFAILIVLALGAIAVVASGWGAPLATAYDDRPEVLVPAGDDLVADDLRRVRFTTVLRGYRMSEVDALLARLAEQLEDAERRAAEAEDPAGRPADGEGDGPRTGV
jgi:DivIVA domain-containing protein